MEFFKHPVKLPTNRKFGLFFTFVFFATAIYFLFLYGVTITSTTLTLIAFAFLTASLLRPQLLSQLNKSWAYLGLLLGLIVSPIVLGAIYFGLFTPIAFVLRLKGRDELRLKNKKLESNWIIRDPIGPTPESFKNQF